MSAVLAARRGNGAVVLLCALIFLLVAGVPSARASFGSPVVVTGADLGEPGIDIAGDGTIYVNGPTGVLSNLPGSPSDVFRSADGGASWTTLRTDHVSDALIDPLSPDTIYVGVWNSGVYKSTSGGALGSWTLLSNGLPKIRYGLGEAIGCAFVPLIPAP